MLYPLLPGMLIILILSILMFINVNGFYPLGQIFLYLLLLAELILLHGRETHPLYMLGGPIDLKVLLNSPPDPL